MDKVKRKRKYSKQKDEVLSVMKTGVTQRQAAQIVGIAEQTISSWRKEYPDFDSALVQIKDDLRAQAVGVTIKHMQKKDYIDGLPTDAAAKTAQWMLENIDNKNFSKKQSVEHTGVFSLGSLIEESKTIDVEPENS